MNPHCLLAKEAVETYVTSGKTITPANLPQAMLEEKAGVFVTLKKNGALRACIGTYQPSQKNIAQEIISNAISAAVEDYRFGPVKKEELPSLSYEVSVLSQLEPVSNLEELNPRKYGILIKTKSSWQKSALLLPDLPGIKTKQEQIDIARQKGGISKEEILIYRFTVRKYE